MGAAVPEKAQWAPLEDAHLGHWLDRHGAIHGPDWARTHGMCCECYRVLPVDRFRRHGYVCADCRTTAASAAEEGE